MQSLMLVLLSCVLTAVGQITFKYGMNHISFNSSDNLLTTLAVVLFNPIIILGFVCFGAGAVIWLFALAKLDLSYAVPLSGLTYILPWGCKSKENQFGLISVTSLSSSTSKITYSNRNQRPGREL